MKDKLAIGIIRTSYGIHGEIKVTSLSGETEHFLKLKDIYLLKKGIYYRFHIEKMRITSNTILLKLEGINTPEKAKELNGLKIWVERDDAAPLQDNEYYFGDLSECKVFKDNKCIGEVRSIFESGNVFMLEVQCIDGELLVIPFRDEYIDQVDIVQGIITVTQNIDLL